VRKIQILDEQCVIDNKTTTMFGRKKKQVKKSGVLNEYGNSGEKSKVRFIFF